MRESTLRQTFKGLACVAAVPPAPLMANPATIEPAPAIFVRDNSDINVVPLRACGLRQARAVAVPHPTIIATEAVSTDQGLLADLAVGASP